MGVAVVLYGILVMGDGRDKVQTRLSIPRATRMIGWCLKYVGPNTNQQD